MRALGIDVGGSGIKGALVDLHEGKLASERVRLKTPASFEMEDVTGTIAKLVRTHHDLDAVGVGFPAAVAHGIVLTPPTAHEVPGWIDRSVQEAFSEGTGFNVSVLNDADAAGLAEVRYGAGRGINGVVITITLGTGVGAGLFLDGRLVPNLEIGKIYLRGHATAVEHHMAGRIKKEQALSWNEYGQRLNDFCRHVEHIFSPQLIVIGGGISQKHRKFLPAIQLKRTRVVPAELRNEAGIIGAAVWASESVG